MMKKMATSYGDARIEMCSAPKWRAPAHIVLSLTIAMFRMAILIKLHQLFVIITRKIFKLIITSIDNSVI